MSLYCKILEDLQDEMGRDAQRAQKTLEFEIGKKVEMLENLDDKYCAGEISKDNYDRISKRYKHEIKELKQKVEILTRNKKGIKKKIDYSLCVINNLTNIMRNGSVEMKIKVLSSMFPEKIEFDGEKYRTNSYNKVLAAHPINSGERKKKSYLCIMENSMLESLVSFMLPSNILSRFTIVKVEI